MKNNSYQSKTYPFYFLVGALVLYLMLFVIPGVMGIYYSFTDWNSYSDKINFIGLQNFKTIFFSTTGDRYMFYIFNTLKFTAVTTILKTALALMLALLVNEGIKFKNLHRAIIFMPAILSMLVTGLIFKSILNPETGLLNEFLKAIHLGGLAQQWLVDLKLAFGSIMAVDIWKGLGYIMTIMLSGLQSIDKSYYEAADIDGGNYFKKFRYITYPLMLPTIAVTLVLNLLYGLKVFDAVYVLTNGGPGDATDVMYTVIFRQFSNGMYGLGTTMSTILFVIMVFVGIFVIKLLNKEEVEV